MTDNPEEDDTPNSENAFIAAIAGTVLLGLFAVGLSFLVKTPLPPQFNLSANDALIGVIATLPPVLFLWWFSNTDVPALAEFRRSQIKFFAGIGFEFTPPRIAAMAVGAGVCEELLFRGVVQTWIDGFAPVAVAVIVSNIIFGVLHMRTVLYAVIAGAVGVYFGVIFVMTENLLAPIIAHGLYDAVALEYTRRAVAAYRAAEG